MTSQDIIKALAKHYGVRSSKVVKLMDIPETYQLENQRFNVMYDDEMQERAAEKLRETIFDVYRELGQRHFFRFGNIKLKTTKENEIFSYLYNCGKDGAQFFLGMIEDIPAFINQTNYQIGWCAMMGAQDHFSLTISGSRMSVFLLKGEYPLVEEGALPEPAHVLSDIDEDIPF